MKKAMIIVCAFVGCASAAYEQRTADEQERRIRELEAELAAKQKQERTSSPLMGEERGEGDARSPAMPPSSNRLHVLESETNHSLAHSAHRGRGEEDKRRAEKAVRDALDDLGEEMKATSPPSPQPSPIKGEGVVASARVPIMPAVLPTPMGIMVPSYPHQFVAYTGRPPNGWGGSVLSVEIENAASRWVVFGQLRANYCYLGFELDGQQVVFERPNGGGSVPILENVKEGGQIRTISVLPPGEKAYLLMDEPGIHNWRARCYEGPHRQVTNASNQLVPVLALSQEARGTRLNPRRIVVDQWDLGVVVGANGRY